MVGRCYRQKLSKNLSPINILHPIEGTGKGHQLLVRAVLSMLNNSQIELWYGSAYDPQEFPNLNKSQGVNSSHRCVTGRNNSFQRSVILIEKRSLPEEHPDLSHSIHQTYLDMDFWSCRWLWQSQKTKWPWQAWAVVLCEPHEVQQGQGQGSAHELG